MTKLTVILAGIVTVSGLAITDIKENYDIVSNTNMVIYNNKEYSNYIDDISYINRLINSFNEFYNDINGCFKDKNDEDIENIISSYEENLGEYKEYIFNDQELYNMVYNDIDIISDNISKYINEIKNSLDNLSYNTDYICEILNNINTSINNINEKISNVDIYIR